MFADGAARAAAARRAALVRLAIWASCVCWLVSQVCQLVCYAERVDAAACVGCLCERRGCLSFACRVRMAEGVSCSASMLLAACLPTLSHFTSSRHPRLILQRSLKPTSRPRSGELPCYARPEVCASEATLRQHLVTLLGDSVLLSAFSPHSSRTNASVRCILSDLNA